MYLHYPAARGVLRRKKAVHLGLEYLYLLRVRAFSVFQRSTEYLVYMYTVRLVSIRYLVVYTVVCGNASVFRKECDPSAVRLLK